MQLELRQILDLHTPAGPEKHYKTNYTFTTEIAGESIDYCFAPNTLCNEYGKDTRLGFSEDDMHFVNKNLHPAVVPFVSLYLHYRNQEPEELVSIIDQEVLSELDREEIDSLILASVLDISSRYLRPSEMIEFIEKAKQEDAYNPEIMDEVIPSVVNSYSLEQNPNGALIAREESSLAFYYERVSEYLAAHHNNRWVRRSRQSVELEEMIGKSAAQACTDLPVRSERAAKHIAEDQDLRYSLASVVELCSELEKLGKGTTVTLDPAQSRVLYICEQALLDQSENIYSHPFMFTAGDTETGTNDILLGAGHQRYFASLRKRLAHSVMQDREAARKAIEDIDSFAARVEIPHEEYRQVAGQIAATGRDLVVSQKVPAIQSTLEDAMLGMEIAITGGIPDEQQMLVAGRAMQYLEELGLPTHDVREKLHAIQSARHADLESRFNESRQIGQ